MSRTDKDRPYWVKVMDEGVETHQHHPGWGGRSGRYTIEKVFDDEGNPVMEEREVKMSAKTVIESQPRLKQSSYEAEGARYDSNTQSLRYFTYTQVMYTVANPVYSEAEHLIAMGMPDAMVTIRIDKVQKTEKHYIPAPEGCDYTDDIHNQKDLWAHRCSKELPYWKSGGYHCRCSRCRPGDEPRQRTRKRVFVTKMVKAANSGEDGWEDDFNELDLAQPNMHHRGWC